MRELKKSRGFEMLVAQTLFFRQSLFDPDRLLTSLLPWVQWVFRPGVLLAGAVFAFVSLAAVVWNFDAVVAQGANFFTLSNLGLTWLLFIVVKLLHEFGHGLTAKQHGAEVHEMGFMFILFAPYLFCNVSDVWRAGKAEEGHIVQGGIAKDDVVGNALDPLRAPLAEPSVRSGQVFDMPVHRAVAIHRAAATAHLITQARNVNQAHTTGGLELFVAQQRRETIGRHTLVILTEHHAGDFRKMSLEISLECLGSHSIDPDRCRTRPPSHRMTPHPPLIQPRETRQC
jgi:hypothetical protein